MIFLLLLDVSSISINSKYVRINSFDRKPIYIFVLYKNNLPSTLIQQPATFACTTGAFVLVTFNISNTNEQISIVVL